MPYEAMVQGMNQREDDDDDDDDLDLLQQDDDVQFSFWGTEGGGGGAAPNERDLRRNQCKKVVTASLLQYWAVAGECGGLPLLTYKNKWAAHDDHPIAQKENFEGVSKGSSSGNKQ